MNKENRIIKIGEVTAGEPLGKEEVVWKDKLRSFSTYEIPLEYLTYNKYNGRILTRTKSIENQNKLIDSETDEGKKLIEGLLWESKPDRNKKTLESISDIGQIEVGIVTKDGIIIDGNRRAMLLNKAEKRYFKAVVLPVTLDENPIEIEKLETSYQMGEDKKLDYNSTEKYLKTQGLYKQLLSAHSPEDSIKQISDWMGESDTKISEWLEVMDTMEQYLDYYGYQGQYTQLDSREDPFIFLTKWLKNFYDSESAKGFIGYKNGDVDDLKFIAFDYIRAQYEGKKFRQLAEGLQTKHLFGNKEVWQSFKDAHFKIIDAVRSEEQPIDFESSNTMANLNGRDSAFSNSVLKLIDDNLDEHVRKIRNKQNFDKPAKLITNAIDSIVAIDEKNIAFSRPEVLAKMATLNALTAEKLAKRAPEKLLADLVNLLENIDLDDKELNQNEILVKVCEINSITFEMKKKLGG